MTYNPSADFSSNTVYYVSVTAYNTAGDAVSCTETSFTAETIVVIPSCAVVSMPSNGATNISVASNLSWLSVTRSQQVIELVSEQLQAELRL